MNKKIYSIIAAALLISLHAHGMQYARKAISYLSLATRITAAGAILANDVKKDIIAELENRCQNDADSTATTIVHDILIEHGVDPEFARSIKIKNDNEMEGSINAHTNASKKYPSISIPAYTIKKAFITGSAKDKNLWKGSIVHEFGHIEHGHKKNIDNLTLANAIWTLYGGAWAIIPKYATTIAAQCLYKKYCEYEADQEAIKRCNADILRAKAQSYADKNQRWHQEHTDKIRDRNIDLEKFNNNLLYREWNSFRVDIDLHPTYLTRARYFEAAALKKEQEEAQLKKA